MLLMSTVYVFVPIIGLVINSVIQILFLRYFEGLAYFKSIIFGFLCGGIFVLIFQLLSLVISELSINFLVYSTMNLITYSFFSLCYFTFINISFSAIRIRLLIELNDSPDGLSIDEILIRYNTKEIVARRIKKLEGNKQIICINERYYVKKSITFLMALIKELLSFIVLGKKSRIKLNKD